MKCGLETRPINLILSLHKTIFWKVYHDKYELNMQMKLSILHVSQVRCLKIVEAYSFGIMKTFSVEQSRVSNFNVCQEMEKKFIQMEKRVNFTNFDTTRNSVKR